MEEKLKKKRSRKIILKGKRGKKIRLKKRTGKKIRLKINPIQKSPEQVRKDLKIFTKGVERLKELENELNSLDTRGFYREEQTIRAKLKNVSDIPVIEKSIKNLRLKINKKYKPRAKRKSPYKQIMEDIDEVMEGVPKIQEHFSKLKSKMKKAEPEAKKRKEKQKVSENEFKCPRCGDVVSVESSTISRSGKKICSACKLIEDFK